MADTKQISRILKHEVRTPAPKGKNRVSKVLARRVDVRAPRYVRESWQELKRVVWPNRRESVKLTGAVLAFTAALTVFTALADFIFSELFRSVFL